MTGAPVTLPPNFWPSFTLGGRAVVARRVDLTADAGLIPDGGTARAGVGIYSTQDLGLTLFAQYDHGQISLDSVTIYDRVQGGPGVTYWVSPREPAAHLLHRPHRTLGPTCERPAEDASEAKRRGR